MSSHAIPHLLGTPHCFQNPCWLGPIPILADFPIFGNEIHKNSLHLAVKSPKITQVLKNPPKFCYELTKKNNIRAHFQISLPIFSPLSPLPPHGCSRAANPPGSPPKRRRRQWTSCCLLCASPGQILGVFSSSDH